MSPSVPPLQLFLASEEDTARLARWLAAQVRAGDALLLDGPIGSGKTHLARALIRARIGNPEEDVPSPTFTLVQTYIAQDGIELWHADLYRIGNLDEVHELGLDAAFDTAIALIEWPDRLGSSAPADALFLNFAQMNDGRTVHLSGADRWTDRLALLQQEWHD